MARTVTTAKQTAESLIHTAALMESHATALRAAAALMQSDPPIQAVEVKNESSRNIGLEYVGNWVDAAKRAAFDARIAAAQIGGARQSGTPAPKGKKS